MTAPITAIVTGYRRPDELITTLRVLHACEPAPAEILVHIDDASRDTAVFVTREFPELTVIVSDRRVGPGGGRNRMVAAARHSIVASFDDDSYPIDRDYFARIEQTFEQFPDAWVVDARVFHLSQAIEPDTTASRWVADFSGGGCAYRRERYLQTGGYVPLPTAYGMEEVDFGLRLHALGGRVLRSGRLRVFHNTDLSHHSDPAITSASIVNVALLTYLRYPMSMWAVGVAQCANRIQWLLRHGRRRGVWRGLVAIPSAIAEHRRERDPLPGRAVRSFLSLRRAPRPA
ncbi:MAG TPA: glycosyltransferase [Vicinamibacterales bacterium]|nr:glycosyltransferase [Vicinamibacterales bacterium]